MNTKSIRGIALVDDILVGGAIILLCAGVYQGYRVLAPGRNKVGADKAAHATATVQTQAYTADSQATAVKVAVADVVQAHGKVDQVHADIEAKAAGGVYGTKNFLDKGDVAGAKAANEVAWAALRGSLTADQQNVWDTLVAANAADRQAIADRDKTIASMTVAAAATTGSLAATQDHANAADAHASELTAQLKVTTTQLVEKSGVAASLAKANAAWADDAETAWDRIKALGWLSVILAVLAVGICVRLFGAQKTLGDAVALVGYIKNEAITAGHDAVLLEQKVHAWFEGDAKSEAAIKTVQTQVLRQ